MAGNFNEKVICCFCGQSLLINDAAVLVIQPSVKSEEEKQQLFCHRKHLVQCMSKEIFLHPDFLED